MHAKARSSTSRRVRGIAEPSALRHHTTDHNERGRERGVAAHFHEHFHPATPRPISSVLMAKGGRLLLREQKQKKGPDTHSSGHNRKIAFPRHLLATSPSLLHEVPFASETSSLSGARRRCRHTVSARLGELVGVDQVSVSRSRNIFSIPHGVLSAVPAFPELHRLEGARRLAAARFMPNAFT